MTTHRKINLGHTPNCPETQQALDKLCEVYKDTFSLHQGNMCNTKLLTMETYTGNHPPSAQKPYTLPVKHIQ